MTRIYALSLCLLAALNTFAAGFSKDQEFRPATAEELALKDVTYAPGASAVVLDWIEVDDDPLSVSSEYYRVKVLTEEGRKYADVEIPYVAGFPYNGRITDIAARTIQPDGRIVPFNGKIYDKVVMKAGGMRLRSKTFSLPEVQPGSILEYRFQRRWADHLLLNTHWNIQRDIPVLRARMTMQPYDTRGEYQSYFTYNNLPPGKIPALSPKKKYELELTDIAPLPNEDFMPPEESLKMSVKFFYTDSQVDTTKFWAAQSSAWNKEVEGYLGKPNALQAQVQPLAGKDSMETLKNIYAKVQTFRNLSFEDETKADNKKNAAAVVTKGEGYRSEILHAFVAMARAAGLDANVVRVGPRDRYFFSANVADSGQMDGEIASVTVDGKTLYFDPGTPTAPFGVVSWEKSNVPGMRIAKGAGPVFNTVADQAPDQAVTRRSADLRLNGDVLEGSVTAAFSGQEALLRRLRTWGEDEATRTKDLEDEAKRWFPDGAAVKLTQVTGATTHAEPLVVKFDVTLPGLVSEAGSRTVLPISVFESRARNPFSSATRTHPIYFTFPHVEEDEVKVTLPETLSLAAVPPAAGLNGGALLYKNQVKLDGSVLTLTRNMTVDAMLIDQKYYGALRNFYSAMVAADQKPLVLVTK
jgi:Domain of Unknown Function with PDB structure (DUF3857)/Transglutaminase-like superfamily